MEPMKRADRFFPSLGRSSSWRSFNFKWRPIYLWLATGHVSLPQKPPLTNVWFGWNLIVIKLGCVASWWHGHESIGFEVLYNLSFESEAIGWSVGPQSHENGFRDSTPSTGVFWKSRDFRPDTLPERVGHKRFLKGRWKSYRLIYNDIKFDWY